MKLSTIIEANTQEILDVSRKEFNELIKRDCKEFLREAQGNNLLRGMKLSPDMFYLKHVRKDRRPMNSLQFIHEIMDEWFLKHFGYRYRSGAVFGTGSFENADSYGLVFDIYPMGNIKYVWSKEVGDLALDIKRTLSGNDLLDVTKKSDSNMIKQVHDTVEDILENGNYQTTNLSEGLEEEVEIMVACDSYYATGLVI